VVKLSRFSVPKSWLAMAASVALGVIHLTPRFFFTGVLAHCGEDKTLDEGDKW